MLQLSYPDFFRNNGDIDKKPLGVREIKLMEKRIYCIHSSLDDVSTHAYIRCDNKNIHFCWEQLKLEYKYDDPYLFNQYDIDHFLFPINGLHHVNF